MKKTIVLILVVFELLCIVRLRDFFATEQVPLTQLASFGDFNHYYATAVMLAHHESPYCRRLADIAANTYPDRPELAGMHWHAILPQATNPPLLALLTTPLAWMHADTAWLVWEFILLWSFVFSLLLISRELAWTRVETLVAAAVLLQCSPAVHNFRFGQVQPVLLLMFVLGWCTIRRGSDLLGGAVWGLAIAIKYYLWPLLLFCLLKNKLKAFFSGTLCFIVGCGLPALLPGNLYARFSECAKPIIERSALFFPMNYSLGGIFQHLRFAMSIPMLKVIDREYQIQFYLVPLALCALLLIFFVSRLKDTPRGFDLGAGAAAFLGILSSPVAWPHYYIFPFALAAFCYTRNQPLLLIVLLLSSLAIPFGLPNIGDLNQLGRYWFALHPLACFVLFGAAFYCARFSLNGERVGR